MATSDAVATVCSWTSTDCLSASLRNRTLPSFTPTWVTWESDDTEKTVPSTSTSAVGVRTSMGRPSGCGVASTDRAPCRRMRVFCHRASNSSTDSPANVTFVPSSKRSVRKDDSPSRLAVPARSLLPTARSNTALPQSLHDAAPPKDTTSTICPPVRGPPPADCCWGRSPDRWSTVNQPHISTSSVAAAIDAPTRMLLRDSREVR